jgi:hypothetical protein
MPMKVKRAAGRQGVVVAMRLNPLARGGSKKMISHILCNNQRHASSPGKAACTASFLALLYRLPLLDVRLGAALRPMRVAFQQP